MTTNRSGVKRYDCTSGGSSHCYGCYTMTETENGEYVSAEDYEALQAECEKLRKDAIQYRRLIELGEDFQWENIIRVDISDFPSRADAIDAAMQRAKP